MFKQEAFKHVQYMFPEVQPAVHQHLLEALVLPVCQPLQAHLSTYWNSKICFEGAAAPCSIWERVQTVNEISIYIKNSNNAKNMQSAFEAFRRSSSGSIEYMKATQHMQHHHACTRKQNQLQGRMSCSAMWFSTWSNVDRGS